MLTSVFFVYGLPRAMQCWQTHTKSGGGATVSSTTPLKLQTLEGLVFFLNGGFKGDITEVIVRHDDPTNALCIAVCVQEHDPVLQQEHQFIVSDLRLNPEKMNGELSFIPIRKEIALR